MQHRYKIWDSKENKWFVPEYPNHKSNITREIFISQAGEIYLYEKTGDFPIITHDKPDEVTGKTRYILNQYIGCKDINGKKYYIRDVVKTKHGIGVLCYQRETLCIAIGSGEVNNFHALDITTKSELQESENLGNVLETPDYWKLGEIK